MKEFTLRNGQEIESSLERTQEGKENAFFLEKQSKRKKETMEAILGY